MCRRKLRRRRQHEGGQEEVDGEACQGEMPIGLTTTMLLQRVRAQGGAGCCWYQVPAREGYFAMGVWMLCCCPYGGVRSVFCALGVLTGWAAPAGNQPAISPAGGGCPDSALSCHSLHSSFLRAASGGAKDAMRDGCGSRRGPAQQQAWRRSVGHPPLAAHIGGAPHWPPTPMFHCFAWAIPCTSPLYFATWNLPTARRRQQ